MDNKKTKRLFLAITPNKEILEQLVKVKDKVLDENLNWVKKENLHITLVFLGNVEENLIPDLIGKLNFVIEKTNKFILKFEKISFAPENNPYMMWAEFENDPNFSKLSDLCQKICSEFSSNKNYTNPKETIPHITLARSKKELDNKNLEIKQLKIHNILVDYCKLMESELSKDGSNYSTIATFTLR
ncbi:MAG: RNA 2',3'-cyclic phosphodiesterase [bacterium]